MSSLLFNALAMLPPDVVVKMLRETCDAYLKNPDDKKLKQVETGAMIFLSRKIAGTTTLSQVEMEFEVFLKQREANAHKQ